MAFRGARVLFPSAIERVARPAARHDRSESNTVQGFLRLRYRSAAPVHVGTGSLALWPASELAPQVLASLRRSGESAAANPLAVREAVRVAGRPGLPGSTLRGALRQRHSRMTRSCAGRASGERGPRGQVPYHPALDPCRGREVCPTCSLFGTTGFASRVRVSDGVVAEDVQFALAPLPAPAQRGRDERGPGRPERGGDRSRPGGGRPERGGGPGGRGGRGDSSRGGGSAPRPAPLAGVPRWVEVIPADTPIAVELAVRNLRDEELGALLGALGCEPVIPLICGAGRALGFGRLYPEGLEVELYRPDGSIEEADVSSWRKAFADSVDRFPAGEDDLLRELGGEA